MPAWFSNHLSCRTEWLHGLEPLPSAMQLHELTGLLTPCDCQMAKSFRDLIMWQVGLALDNVLYTDGGVKRHLETAGNNGWTSHMMHERRCASIGATRAVATRAVAPQTGLCWCFGLDASRFGMWSRMNVACAFPENTGTWSPARVSFGQTIYRSGGCEKKLLYKRKKFP